MAHLIRRTWRSLGGSLLMAALVACGNPSAPSSGSAATRQPLPTRAAPTALAEKPTVESAAPAPATARPEPTVAPQPAQPILGFAPTAGGSGTPVSVWGSGYAPNARVALRIGFPQPTGEVLASVVSDGSGSWQASLIIPERLPSGEQITRGDMFLVAMDEANQPLASAPFGFIVGAEPADQPAGHNDWPGAEWQILSSGDFNGDGEKEVVYFTPGDIQPQATFYDAYLSSQARLISQAMIVQGHGETARVLLAIDQQGIQAEGVSQASFGADATGPAGFLLALDPGSTTFINLLPLDVAGEDRGQEIGINWNQSEQAYRVSPPAR